MNLISSTLGLVVADDQCTERLCDARGMFSPGSHPADSGGHSETATAMDTATAEPFVYRFSLHSTADPKAGVKLLWTGRVLCVARVGCCVPRVLRVARCVLRVVSGALSTAGTTWGSGTHHRARRWYRVGEGKGRSGRAARYVPFAVWPVPTPGHLARGLFFK